MEEKPVGNFDLPQSIGYVISRLIRQKFPRETAAINRDGTMTVVFDDKDKMERNETIELQFGKMIFRYEAIKTKTVSGDAKCLHCKSDYIKTIYSVTYELKELWQGRHNLTERYKIGGDLTESKIRISTMRREQTQSEESKVAIYT
jgi:hypothetical protein